jgi:excinuclease ABC subunit C
VGYVTPEAHDELVAEAELFLSGKSQDVKAELARQMEEAAARLEFETAARTRDRIQAMSFVTQSQGINPQTVDEADVFALAQEGGQTCIQVSFFRSGQNWGNRPISRADKSLEGGKLASSSPNSHDDKPVPGLILLSHEIAERELMKEAFTTHAGHRVEIACPRRGEKKVLVDHAASNAREAMGRKMAESASQAKLLEGVARVFNLPEPPKRIEVYDNSHIQGANPVGAMIVAGPEGLIKSQYRKFNIKAEDIASDDFAMMREVLTRRFSRLLKEQGERKARWPDFVLIDGSQGQLSRKRGRRPQLDFRMGCRGRTGMQARLHRPAVLHARSARRYSIYQQLRDGAHRFAVARTGQSGPGDGANPLDEILKIGPLRESLLRPSDRRNRWRSLVGLAASKASAAPGAAIYDHFTRPE